MKRLLPILPVVLFIFLNACANSSAEAISPDIGTRVAHTQTASVWTPTISPTPDSHLAEIVNLLNSELSSADSLEKTLVATYSVTDMTITSATLRVYVNCQCGANMQCCSPERMYVRVMLAMKKHPEEILNRVPNNASEVKVICYNNMTQIGVMFAFWSDVRGYLGDQIMGDQLGARAHRIEEP